MPFPNTPTIRFIVELKSEKLVKNIDRKTETFVEAVEALPEQQQEYWEQTRAWIDSLIEGDETVYAVRAGVLIVNIHLPDVEDVHRLRGLLRDFKPFQITPYTRASKFTFFPDGLGGVGYGPGLPGGPLKKYFSKHIAKKVAASYLRALSARERNLSVQKYRSL